jgi:hypothetical protein
MRRGIYLAVVGGIVLGAVIVTASGAQVYPVRLDQQEPQPAAPTPPSLVLADGGIEFPDGTVQVTATGGGAPAPVPRTGQATCYDGQGAVTHCGLGSHQGQDGHLQLGVTWPNPRFTKNGDGTVTDNLTGLIWLENADCAAGGMTWSQALFFAITLFDGSVDHAGGDCGLSDGSTAGEWRLPNVRELQSLVHYEFEYYAIPNTAGTGQWLEGDPFTGLACGQIGCDKYWSSTTRAGITDNALYLRMNNGGISWGGKNADYRVWPVRGGQ